MFNVLTEVMMAASTGRKENSQPSHIDVYVGGRQITDVIIKEINKKTYQYGKCPIVF